MMFYLNVQDDHDDVQAYAWREKTDIGHNTCMHATFHKALIEWDWLVYMSLCVPIINPI